VYASFIYPHTWIGKFAQTERALIHWVLT